MLLLHQDRHNSSADRPHCARPAPFPPASMPPSNQQLGERHARRHFEALVDRPRDRRDLLPGPDGGRERWLPHLQRWRTRAQRLWGLLAHGSLVGGERIAGMRPAARGGGGAEVTRGACADATEAPEL